MNLLKRYLVVSALLFLASSLYSVWRESCTAGCSMHVLVLGLPVFLRTPFSPDSPDSPQFYFIKFLINLGWFVVASVCFWAVVDTLKRWRERTRQPMF